jgi:NAD(P)-dependent dehydrogenase (short-subunit alcohol dehydrogenase family)
MPDASALIVGVGPGLGAALARRFAKGGLKVAVAARRADRLAGLAAEIGGRAYACDVADEAAVERLFAAASADLGAPAAVVYNAGAFARRSILEMTAEEFERCWRIGCLGGFLVGRAAARAMLPAGSGSILFTGATASLRGGANFAAFAAGKFALRAVAQSMARELGPSGIHVAHVIIDGQIEDATREGRGPGARGEAAMLHPDAIAEAYWQLHVQPKSAWTHELDLRPWVEKF